MAGIEERSPRLERVANPPRRRWGVALRSLLLPVLTAGAVALLGGGGASGKTYPLRLARLQVWNFSQSPVLIHLGYRALGQDLFGAFYYLPTGEFDPYPMGRWSKNGGLIRAATRAGRPRKRTFHPPMISPSPDLPWEGFQAFAVDYGADGTLELSDQVFMQDFDRKILLDVSDGRAIAISLPSALK